MTQINACLLPSRGIIRIGGADRRAFLQGLISNDIELCQPGQPLYAALLTPQGKFLHDMFIVDSGEDFLVDCESARADDLIKRLGMYKLRSKVTFENAANDFDVWVLWQRQDHTVPLPSREVLGAGAIGNPDDEYLYPDPRFPALGHRAIIKKGQAPKNKTQTDFSNYDKHRLTLGIPDGSRDMLIEKSTLLECNLDKLNAISWSKGCYMGQELTARMHYRALAKKRMFSVAITGPAPAHGTIIHFNSEDIGDMRSSCNGAGLALLNIEKAQMAMQSGVDLTCGNCRLKPYKPDWLNL